MDAVGKFPKFVIKYGVVFGLVLPVAVYGSTSAEPPGIWANL